MKSVSPEEAQKLIESGEVLIIDVRTPAEFAEGHIGGARNININDQGFAGAVKTLDPNAIYLVNCLSGGRSSMAASFMTDSGFTKVNNLEGGMGAWKRAGLPIEG
ncbi:MAG: rhodanese-like domain-containing protein [Minisyncoccia bacterium]